jgi:protein phosphatase PTC2/3
MEDSHAVLLKLDEGSEKSNAFFAVYDGHGGMFVCYQAVICALSLSPGSTVAQFAGQNVHKRLLKEEAYQEKRYDEAMKRAFLGTDEDLLAGVLDRHHRLARLLMIR